jgi:TRAP-type C4-dicarboxylate transport system substrate-binding protein
VVLRENLIHPATDYMAKYTQTAANRFNAKWAGKYEITVHPGGALVGMAESLDGVRTGVVEIGQYPPGVFSNTDVRFTSAELPFLYNNVEANIAACEKLLPVYSEMMEQKFNQKALALWTATSLDLISTKPIKTMADWKGLQVHAINPPCAAVITTLGGSPVSGDFPEAYSMLSKKVADAGMYATTQMVEYNMWEVAKYVVPVYMVPTSSCLPSIWTPEETAEGRPGFLLEEHQKMANDLNALYEVLSPPILILLAEKGVNVYFLPKDERDRWHAAMQPWITDKMNQMAISARRSRKSRMK